MSERTVAPRSDRTGAVGYLEGIRQAQREEMQRDARVILLGQDVVYDVYGTSTNLAADFGAERVRDVPLSEAATVGAGAGAAMAGLRPIVDLTVASFAFGAMDQFVSQVAKNRYMFGGQARIPVVYRFGLYYRGGSAAHHADRPYPMFMNVPGLKIITPSNGADAKGLLKAAIRDDNPVLCFEDKNLWGRRGRGVLPECEDHVIPLGVAACVREGTDVTVVAIAGGVPLALEAAQILAQDGISAEVIDPRSLVPMDWETIVGSVARTGRCVIVDPATRTCSAASEIAAHLVDYHFDLLQGPVRRVTAIDMHVPYSPALEPLVFPDADTIVQAVRATE
jgi:pyruvate dehydrogenase E1 component beta subunit